MTNSLKGHGAIDLPQDEHWASLSTKTPTKPPTKSVKKADAAPPPAKKPNHASIKTVYIDK